MGFSLRILCLITLGLFLYSCTTTPAVNPPEAPPETQAQPEAAAPPETAVQTGIAGTPPEAPETAAAPEGILAPEAAVISGPPTPPEPARPSETPVQPETAAPPETAALPETAAPSKTAVSPKPSGPPAPPEAAVQTGIAGAPPETPAPSEEQTETPPESALKAPEFPDAPQLAGELPKASPKRPESPPAKTKSPPEAPYPERPKPPPAPEYILGEGRIPLSDLKYFLLISNPGMDPVYIENLSRFYIEEAASEGVNHDVAFAQMCLETGYLRYGGLVTPDMNNFCGLGALGPGQRGEYFPSPRIGVRAHIQHLKAYATDAPLRQELVDPRYHWVRPGKSPTLDGLAGTWATDLQYATKIRGILTRLYNFSFQLDKSRMEPGQADSEISPESLETGSVVSAGESDYQTNSQNSFKTY